MAPVMHRILNGETLLVREMAISDFALQRFIPAVCTRAYNIKQ
jgi:hypothetical protein